MLLREDKHTHPSVAMPAQEKGDLQSTSISTTSATKRTALEQVPFGFIHVRVNFSQPRDEFAVHGG